MGQEVLEISPIEEKWSKLYNKHKDYETILDILSDDFVKTWRRSPNSPYGNLEQTYLPVVIVGTGTFGTVKLFKHKSTNKYFAVKILVKEFIVKKQQAKQVCSERKVLSAACFPFLVHLEFSLKDNTCLYLGLPFINGGELFMHHKKLKRFNEKQAKFYAAQVILAIQYLHHSNTIYRDLKTENILLESNGYIKLTDFGFCKRILSGATWSFCGTPEYLAPEVISFKAYGKSVDYWAFGVLVYELVAGYSPFITPKNDVMKMYERICTGTYQNPEFFSPQLKSLVEDLLRVDVTKRLGNLRSGCDGIKSHPWFQGINWTAILNKEVAATYLPKVQTMEDYMKQRKYAKIQCPESKKNLFSYEFAEF